MVIIISDDRSQAGDYVCPSGPVATPTSCPNSTNTLLHHPVLLRLPHKPLLRVLS